MISNLIKNKIDEHKIISFDMFDTLVRRNVANPSDVFLLVEDKYNNTYVKDRDLQLKDFKKYRILAYEQAYKKNGAKCRVDDIYEELPKDFQSIKEILKKIEIDIESKICVPNKEIVDIFNYANEIGKKIVIISDMYLSEECLVHILDRCGIKNYDGFFISCEYGKSKTNGLLYDICCKEMGVSYNEILHFGDGLKNDIIRAKQKKIDTIWYRKKVKLDYNDFKDFNKFEKEQYDIQQAFIRNHIEELESEVEKIGFSVFGPLVYGFCRWLHDQIIDQSIEKIFFLAREGLLFKKIYESLYPKDSEKNKYLYVSRKSLIAPTYWIAPEYENVIKSISKSKMIKVETLVERWGLDVTTCIDELQEVGLERDTVVDGRKLNENNKIKELYDSLKKTIVDKSKEDYKILEQYLEQEEFGGKCAIVDIGWNGGMQNALTKIASIWKYPTEVHGYYIGINYSNLGIELNNINGFVYNQTKCDNNRYSIYSFAGPLELSLTAIHGTTMGYRHKGNRIIPILDEKEYINDNGTYNEEYKYIINVQRGIEKFTELWIKEGMMDFTKIYSEVSFRNCKLFGLCPKAKHIKIYHRYGSNDLGINQHFVNPQYKAIFGKHNIWRGFWSSTWKSGYLKMLFKFPLPYYKIYILMRKRIN